MNENIKKYIDKLKEEIVFRETEIKQLEKLVEKFPDLEVTFNRWDRKRYSSSYVNKEATDCSLNASCGCCSDAEIRVHPYLIYDGTKIYSNPVHIGVGQGNYDGGDSAYNNWKKNLRKHNISQVVIDKVKKYFEKEKNRYDDD